MVVAQWQKATADRRTIFAGVGALGPTILVVARGRRFGLGERAVQEQQPHPIQQVDGEGDRGDPGGVDRNRRDDLATRREMSLLDEKSGGELRVPSRRPRPYGRRTTHK